MVRQQPHPIAQDSIRKTHFGKMYPASIVFGQMKQSMLLFYCSTVVVSFL